MKLSNTLFSLLTLFCCYSLPVKDSKADLATDTEIIFDWAEKKFPQFFPFSSAPTQFSDPWLYRYYPLTDVYVGVKTNKEVWVSGNVFGGLMFINPVQELLSTIFMDQQPSFRIKRVLHDLDNNGMPEGITKFSYDNEGYLSNETYTYMDDGTPDSIFRSLSSIGTPEKNSITSYTYNDFGQLISSSRTLVGSTLKYEKIYSYNSENQLIQVEDKTINSQGNVIFRIKLEMVYTGRLLTHWEESGSDTLRFVGSSANFKYNIFGSIESITHFLFGSGNVSSSSTNFIYNGAGHIISDQFTTFIYDDEHQLTEKKGLDLSSIYSYENGLEKDWIIHVNSDGIAKAKLTTEWEEGLCKKVFSGRPRRKDNFFLYDYYPKLHESIFFKLPGC